LRGEGTEDIGREKEQPNARKPPKKAAQATEETIGAMEKTKRKQEIVS
jgi:hypothetical protein